MIDLPHLFNYDLDQSSPVVDDYMRKVNYDEDGNEFITFEKVDYPKLQKSLGSAKDWSLEALLKAGIDPKFGIHTGNPTRIEGLGELDAFTVAADTILNETSKE